MARTQLATDTAIATTPDVLRVYSSLTRRTEPFKTIDPGEVRMYVCGVTVYDDAHIGHGMSAISFDVIRRYLEHLGYRVHHAQNFTDIDDKIIARANREGIDPDHLTGSLIDAWMEEQGALNVLPATIYPRATEEVDGIIQLILGLIERGNAYESAGDVYFRVRSFPNYGKLSRRDPDDLRSGARIDVDERKDDPLDFALWKAAKPGEPSWPSPWGDGRPGWHIECSAMCMNHLDGMIDIHGGGSDLIFPHHENEIAQSEAWLGTEPFARYWLHNGMLRLNGEKMSKSLGNVVKLRDLIARRRTDAFRLLVLQSHYRSPLTFSDEGLESAQTGLQRLRAAARPVSSPGEASTELADEVASTERRFHEAMCDDFNAPGAVAALFELARSINRLDPDAADGTTAAARDTLASLAALLGLNLRGNIGTTANEGDIDALLSVLIDIRRRLREERQFQLADELRDRLELEGFILEDTRTGTEWKRA